MTVFPLLLTLLVASAFCVRGFVISRGEDVITLQRTGAGYKFLMPENNHDEDPRRFIFKVSVVDGFFEPTITDTLGFNYTLEKQGTSWSFYSESTFDYETQLRFYVFDLHVGPQFKTITLYIQNIDDEPPTLECPDDLVMNDDTSYDIQSSTCECRVSDPDGFLGQMTFVLSGADGNKFKMDFAEDISDVEQKAVVKIANSTRLDPISSTKQQFKVEAKDGAGHSTVPNATVDVQITVEHHS